MTAPEFYVSMTVLVIVWLIANALLLVFVKREDWRPYLTTITILTIGSVIIIFTTGCAEAIQQVYEGGLCYNLKTTSNPLFNTWNYVEIECAEMGIEIIKK